MTKLVIESNVGGTGTLTIYAPSTSNVATINLPTATGTLLTTGSTGLNASNITEGTLANDRTTASSSNGANTIVLRDASGNFSANIITADGSALTAINASNVSSGTLATGRGGTGLTGFTAANNAVYSTSSSALTAGTLPVTAGGTGQTTYTDGQLLIGNTTGNTLTKAALTGTANQIIVTNGSGSITLSAPQSINTASNVQFGSFGVGTAASGTTGEIRATNNVTAYYSSDRKFKENIKPIPNAVETVSAIGGVMFDWTDDYLSQHGGEDGYFVQKSDFGVIAQDVLKVFPTAVRTREDGSLAVDYEKLSALAFAAIKELKERIEKLEG